MADGTRATRDTRFLKFGALSLLGNAGVVVLLYALFFWVAATNSLSGVDTVHSFLIRLSTLVPAIIIIAAHVALARNLLAEARRHG